MMHCAQSEIGRRGGEAIQTWGVRSLPEMVDLFLLPVDGHPDQILVLPLFQLQLS